MRSGSSSGWEDAALWSQASLLYDWFADMVTIFVDTEAQNAFRGCGASSAIWTSGTKGPSLLLLLLSHTDKCPYKGNSNAIFRLVSLLLIASQIGGLDGSSIVLRGKTGCCDVI